MKYSLVLFFLLFCGFGCHSVVNEMESPTSAPVVTPTPAVSENITVTSPLSGSTVSNPIHVTGEARVFENVVSWRLLTSEGLELSKSDPIMGTTFAEASDIGQFGPFDFWVVVPEVGNVNVMLEVYQVSAKDGSAVDVVSIPLVLDRIDTTDLQIYLHNNVMDPEITCTTVFPVTRKITATVSPARAAMVMLLEGPTSLETANHYSTVIPFPSVLKEISISADGLAMVDLGGAIVEPLGGSCLVGGIGAEIEYTLKQFESVKEVKILLDGKEDALQP